MLADYSRGTADFDKLHSEDLMNQHVSGGYARIVITCVLLLWCISGAVTLHAQQFGSLDGTITGPGGRVLSHATVSIQSKSKHYSRILFSNGHGHVDGENLPAGTYQITVTDPGFSPYTRSGIVIPANHAANISVRMSVGRVSQRVFVSAEESNSLAARSAPVQTPLNTTSARSEISTRYIRLFSSPVTDLGDVLQAAPGTFSISPNGVGLGQDRTYFRGFQNGEYDMTWDGIPWNDTNGPSHHTWAFFPSQWWGGIDFVRSPGSASTIGPASTGGSINMYSRKVPASQGARVTTSYGSYNTVLIDGQYDSGKLPVLPKLRFTLDVQRMTSSGYQTWNHQQREAGDIKFVYRFSPSTVLTAFSGFLMLDNNTPNTATPTRAQVAKYGYNYLLNNDPSSPYYYRYNGYNLPTDFEYIGLDTDLGHGWHLDVKPYTYAYKNHQHYTDGGNLKTVTGGIDPSCAIPVNGILPCASDQRMAYHKYGEVARLSQASRYGVFRTGLWYEWAYTDRYLYPTNPLTGQFAAVPSYHETFITNSYQPYAEYMLQATPNLTITAGTKYAYYNQNLTQYADNGKSVGNLGGKPYVKNSADYNSWLPSAALNYRIRPDWSAYVQFAQGSIIPPTKVFDVKKGAVHNLPKPTRSTTYQAGSVLKMNRLMLDGDWYWIKFQNTYSTYTPPNGGVPVYYLGPDSISQGIELESSVSAGGGLTIYANGTVGKATYTGTGVPSNLWVANTPSYTEGFGAIYTRRRLNLGFFQKRIGPMWNDNKSYHNQVAIKPFSFSNVFLNYSIRGIPILNRSRIGLSVNNLLNAHDIIGVKPGTTPIPVIMPGGVKSPYLATTNTAGSDLLSLTPGRSIMVTLKIGLHRRR